MTAAAPQWSPIPAPPPFDQRVVVYGVPFRTYSAIRELLDSPGIRLTYLEGALEIMSPSPLHEDLKKRIARLVELFALERDVPLYGYGSTTFRREAKERGLEPDECYVLGHTLHDYPDIALEVALTSGGIDKLAVYEGLGVREVWFWKENHFELFELQATGYEPRGESTLVPGLDFAELAEFVQRADQHEALKEYRARLTART